MNEIIPRITGISTARPDQDIHQAFVGWAESQITDSRERALFARMAELNLRTVHVYGLTETYGPITVSPWLPGWLAGGASSAPERDQARRSFGVLVGELPWRGEEATLKIDKAKRALLKGELVVTVERVDRGMPDKPTAPPTFAGNWMPIRI